MPASNRPSFDPKKAKGALGASLFDAVTNDTVSETVDKTSLITKPQSSRKKKQSRSSISKKKATVDRLLTVTEITGEIGRVLIDHLPRRVRVVGEISNLSKRNHWYFSLKDDKAVIGCVAWASKARSFRFDAKDGLEVVATGSVQFYGPQGRCQLYVDKLEPVGAGALELRYRALCDELRRLGYFDPARKKRVPFFPRSIAVITSEKGAALQDVLDTLRRRCPAIGVYLVDVRVQGESAGGEIAAALYYIRNMYQQRNIDAVILTRGGGSIEDLWAFNERVVADALLDYPIATIAAIGHETDTTIAELVADVRCATPTQAAMAVSPDRSELLIQLDQMVRRLTMRLDHQMRYDRERLRTAEAGLRKPSDWIGRYRDELRSSIRHLHHVTQGIFHHQRHSLHRQALALERIRPHRLAAHRMSTINLRRYQLTQAIEERLRQDRLRIRQTGSDLKQSVVNKNTYDHHRLQHLNALLTSVDPQRIIRRGYTITRDEETGHIIQSISDVQPDTILNTTAEDGTIRSTVIDTKRRKDGNQYE